MKQNYDVEKIHPNPYQTRRVVIDDDLRALADSIREHDLQEVPTARPFADRKGHVQLVKGHRRLEAWKIAFPGKPMPVEVGDYTDRQMFDFNVIENMQRADLMPVEQAKQIALYIETFKVSQNDAAKLFGLQTQSAVSNKLRLLKLPASVQTMVDDGKLAERHARLLVQLAAFNLKAVEKIAKRATAAKDATEREEFINDGIMDAMKEHAIDLNNAPFDLDWLKKPVAVADPDVKELRDCKGCPHFCAVTTEYEGKGEFCAFAKCYTLKVEHFREHELHRVSDKEKIAIAEKDETVYPVVMNTYDQREVMEKAIARADVRALLRVMPLNGDSTDDDHEQSSYALQNLLGTKALKLMTTEKDLLSRLMKVKDKPGKSLKALSPEKQREEDEAGRAERRAEKAAKLKAMHDVSWLVINASRLIGERLDIGGGLLPFLLDGHRLPEAHFRSRLLLATYEEELGDAIDDKKLKEKQRLAKQKEYVAFCLVGSEAIDRYSRELYDWEDVHDSIKQIISPDQLALKLPRRWDVPPIHHTAYNCWHCGDFASSQKLTKRDLAEGWETKLKGKDIVDVKCPACNNGHKPAAKAAKKGSKKK